MKINIHSNFYKFVQRIVISLCFLAFIFSCNHINSQKKTSSDSIVVTDFRGKQILFNHPAKRIVCLIESSLSGLYMLNAEKKVIGISSNIYEESVFKQYASMDKRIADKSLPTPGNWDFVNIESVIAFQPDLVIMWSQQKETIEALEEKGIPVYGVMLKSLNDVYKEIADFGILTGTTSRADTIINYTKDELKKFSNCLPKKIKPQSVYFSWAQGILETSGQNSTVNELINLAGAKNVCDAKDEHLVINMEKLIEWNPDVMVMWYDQQRKIQDIYQMKELNNINAVKNKKVFKLPSVFFCDLWTLKFQYTVKLLAKWTYDNDFEKMNLENEKKNMIFNLYGHKGLQMLNE